MFFGRTTSQRDEKKSRGERIDVDLKVFLPFYVIINKEYMIKNMVILFMVLMLGVGVLFAVQKLSMKNEPRAKDLEKITVGWNNWPGLLPILVAKEKGIFEEQGLQVDLSFKDSYLSMVDDLATGKIDLTASMAFLDVMTFDGDLQIVGVTDYSNGADGIVAKKEIIDLKTLVGKTIAVEKGTLGEYLLLSALDKVGLTLNDVIIKNMSAEQSAQAFISGQVDVAVAYEPDFSLAVKEGNGWKIFTSADELGMIIDAVVVKKEFAENNSEKIKSFLKAQFKATQFIASNPKEAYAIGAKYFKISPAEFEQQMLGIKLLDQRDNVTAFTFAAGYESLFGNARYINLFLKRLNKIKQDIDVTKMINQTFIRQINQE